MRIVTGQGALLIYDAEGSDEALEVPTKTPPMLAYWADFEDGRLYVFGRTLTRLVDAGHALRSLSRQFDIDAASVAMKDALLLRCLSKASIAAEDDTPWHPASETMAEWIVLTSRTDAVTVAMPPIPPDVSNPGCLLPPAMVREPVSLLDTPPQGWAIDDTFAFVLAATHCGGCTGRCCGNTNPCCGEGPCCGCGSECCDDFCCPDGAIKCCPTLEGGSTCSFSGVCCNGGSCPQSTMTCCDNYCWQECCQDGPAGEYGCPLDHSCCEGSCCTPDRECAKLGTGACCAIGAPACDPATQPCCQVGGTCCPDKHCCTSVKKCCGAQCCAIGTEECCTTGQIDHCRPLSADCCGNGYCSSGSQCCPGDHCCLVTESCCGQTECCAPGTFCCPADEHCCDNGEDCCGANCCPAGKTCRDAATVLCCDADVDDCGSSCCGVGETCRDAATGKCCPAAVIECNGSCCEAGEICCGGNTCCLPIDCCDDRCLGEACCNDPCCVDPCSCMNCDDNNLCTTDSCSNGVCVNQLISCDDNNPCTIDSCTNDTCMHDPICDTGQYCCEGLCCNTICDGCIDNGQLTGGTAMIDESPVCVGDKITWRIDLDALDNGGVKRVPCNAKAVIPSVTPTYTWKVTKPDGIMLAGSGKIAIIVSDIPGDYSCIFTANANRECPPPSITIDAGIAEALPNRVVSVTFSGAAMRNVARDDGSGVYPTPHWADNSSPLNDDNDDVGDYNIPVIYPRNTTMLLSAVFTVDPPLDPLLGATVHGSATAGGTVYQFTGEGIIAGNTVSITNVPADQPLANKVDYFNPLVINWSITTSGPNPVECTIPSTQHRVYVTLGPPTASPLYETVVDIACRNALGGIVQTGVVPAIYNDFRDRDVRRKLRDGFNNVDNTQMRYWVNANDPLLPTVQAQCQSVEAMLDSSPSNPELNGIGTCLAWARLLIGCTEVHGIATVAIVEVESARHNDNGLSLDGGGTDRGIILVKSWSFATNGTAPLACNPFDYRTLEVTDNNGAPGQGATVNPPAEFFNHFIVSFNGNYYDPSYGTSIVPTQSDWEEASLDGYRKACGTGPTIVTAKETTAVETHFD